MDNADEVMCMNTVLFVKNKACANKRNPSKRLKGYAFYVSIYQRVSYSDITPTTKLQLLQNHLYIFARQFKELKEIGFWDNLLKEMSHPVNGKVTQNHVVRNVLSKTNAEAHLVLEGEVPCMEKGTRHIHEIFLCILIPAVLYSYLNKLLVGSILFLVLINSDCKIEKRPKGTVAVTVVS